MADIPVYLVAGFLDAGKTNFINGILEDGFARQDPTLLLCCEEGEEEYEKNALDNVTVITIEDEEDLKCSYLKELEKEYHPKQVLIEYNGMWQMERLYREVLPANWVLYQIMTFVYAPTFEMYAKNMGQLMMEKITNADMLVFNRCTPELRDALRKRNLRMVNRRADIYLEMEGRHQRGLPHRRRVPLRPEPGPDRRAGRRLRCVVCGRDGSPGPLGGQDGPHEAYHVPLQEVPGHPLPRPLCHDLL